MVATYRKVIAVPCAAWNLVGLFARQYALNTYLQFSLRFLLFYGAQYKSQISVLQTLATLVGGIFSNVFYGWFCDRFEQKSLWTKALVCGSSLLGTSICYFLMFYPFFSITFPLSMIVINTFLFEGFTPPSVSMMVNTCGVGKSPVIALMIAAFATAQLIQSAVCAIVMPLDATFDQLRFGILVNTVIPASCASFCFYMSGFDYVSKLTESNNQRAEALEKAKEIPEIQLQLSKRNSQV